MRVVAAENVLSVGELEMRIDMMMTDQSMGMFFVVVVVDHDDDDVVVVVVLSLAAVIALLLSLLLWKAKYWESGDMYYSTGLLPYLFQPSLHQILESDWHYVHGVVPSVSVWLW